MRCTSESRRLAISDLTSATRKATMTRNSYERNPTVVVKRRAVHRIAKYESQALSKIARRHNETSTREIWPRDNAVDWKDDRVWEKIRDEGCYHKSDEIIVSCGTVTINQADSSQPEVLVVYNKRIGIYQLPKGRKDFGEDFLNTAIRETTEETGIDVRPLRLRFGSRSTPPRLATTITTTTICSTEDLNTGITTSLSNEMIGVSEW